MWLLSEVITAEVIVGMKKYSNCFTLEHSSLQRYYAVATNKQLKTYQIIVKTRTALP
jgi:hypothetical protein